MTELVRGIVINLNTYGATIRLETGELASAPAGDVEGHRGDYERALSSRSSIVFQLHGTGRKPMVTIAPQIADERLDEQIAEYLRSTEEWSTDANGIPVDERHFLQKKKRAAFFEKKQQ